MRIPLLTLIFPLGGNAVHRKLRRVVEKTDVKCTRMGLKVVPSVGNGTTVRLGTEIMVMNLLWRTPPARTGITKTSDALLLLGIYADEGQTCTNGPRPKRSNEVVVDRLMLREPISRE